MQILTDEKGFVTSYALEGTLVDGIDISEPKDIDHFKEHFMAYRIRDGDLVYDEAQDEKNRTEETREALRILRERECFPVINRGQLWYDTLTDNQKAELADWYQSWLCVTETLSPPESLNWLS